MIVTKRSIVSGNVNTMDLDITKEQLKQWESGELIQQVFPKLGPDEREFLKTGITPDEWDNTFGGDE